MEATTAAAATAAAEHPISGSDSDSASASATGAASRSRIFCRGDGDRVVFDGGGQGLDRDRAPPVVFLPPVPVLGPLKHSMHVRHIFFVKCITIWSPTYLSTSYMRAVPDTYTVCAVYIVYEELKIKSDTVSRTHTMICTCIIV